MNENSNKPQPRQLPSRIVGIDYGMARIGIAISDERKIIASPLQIIKAEAKSEQTAQKVAEVLKDIQNQYRCEIQELVIGIPLRMNGKMGMMADEVKHFIDILKTIVLCPIVTWDERLTSVQADRSLRESNMTRKKRSKLVDIVTAAIILQSYLDSKPSSFSEI